MYIPPGEILVGGSGELGRTQILPPFLFGSVEVFCALELPDETHRAHASRVEAMRMVRFIPALYPFAKQILKITVEIRPLHRLALSVRLFEDQ